MLKKSRNEKLKKTDPQLLGSQKLSSRRRIRSYHRQQLLSRPPVSVRKWTRFLVGNVPTNDCIRAIECPMPMPIAKTYTMFRLFSITSLPNAIKQWTMRSSNEPLKKVTVLPIAFDIIFIKKEAMKPAAYWILNERNASLICQNWEYQWNNGNKLFV